MTKSNSIAVRRMLMKTTSAGWIPVPGFRLVDSKGGFLSGLVKNPPRAACRVRVSISK